MPSFFGNFESNIKKSGSGFLTKDASYADLALFHVVAGVSREVEQFESRS